ncbi:MAG TPA: hypothetical protein VKX40_07765 [Aequorivita sp.]|nr:hypothetical protein [Aequorivita sp.]
MKKLILITAAFLSFYQIQAQDTLNYELVDAFRIDKKYSPEILNYLIKKGELTKSEIDERRLNVFQYVYVIDIIEPNKLNENGIYRFGIIRSHGDVYLLVKSDNQVEIINEFTHKTIEQKVDEFLNLKSNEFDDITAEKYKTALSKWFENRSY